MNGGDFNLSMCVQLVQLCIEGINNGEIPEPMNMFELIVKSMIDQNLKDVKDMYDSWFEIIKSQDQFSPYYYFYSDKMLRD